MPFSLFIIYWELPIDMFMDIAVLFFGDEEVTNSKHVTNISLYTGEGGVDPPYLRTSLFWFDNTCARHFTRLVVTTV